MAVILATIVVICAVWGGLILFMGGMAHSTSNARFSFIGGGSLLAYAFTGTVLLIAREKLNDNWRFIGSVWLMAGAVLAAYIYQLSGI